MLITNPSLWHGLPKTAPMSNSPSPVPAMDRPSHRLLLQLLLFISLLSLSHALIGSDDEDIKFDARMLLGDESESLKSRLSTLLQLKQSIRELMEERDRQLSPSGQPTEPDILLDKDDTIVTEKRVFCNGFTGCGGRFRGRRIHQRAMEASRKRMLKAAASKRPFCNTNGCFNGGKKKKSEDIARPVNPDTTFSFDDGFDIGKQRVNPSASSKTKRLFCNGYGGCRNMGKRRSLLAGDQATGSQHHISTNERKPLLQLLLQPGKQKRFFASAFDSKMDNFVNNLPS